MYTDPDMVSPEDGQRLLASVGTVSEAMKASLREVIGTK